MTRQRVLEFVRSASRSTFCLLPLVLLSTCAAELPYVWVQDLPVGGVEGQPVIQSRDTIVVHVRDQPALSGEFVVRDDGGYLHPTLGNVLVGGRSPAQVAVDLQNRLTGLIVNAQVTVSIARTASVRVSVVGEVRTPGAYELARDRSVTAALAAAGWLTEFAAKNRIFVVRHGDRDLRVRFDAKDLTAAEPSSSRFRLRDGDVVVAE